MEKEIVEFSEAVREQRRYYKQEIWHSIDMFANRKKRIDADIAAVIAQEFAGRSLHGDVPQGLTREQYKQALLSGFDRIMGAGCFNPFRIGFRMDHGAVLQTYAVAQRVMEWGGVDLGGSDPAYERIRKYLG